jgi:FKBP-type peptidyl-prolyl cis-trans isomerase FkpA
MYKSITLGLVVSLGLLTACNKEGSMEKLKSGSEYKIVETKGNPKADTSKFVEFHLSMFNEKDSLLGSSFKMQNGKPFSMKVPASPQKFSIEEALTLMGEGDSLQLFVPTDSIFKGFMETQRPEFLPKGTKLKFHFRMLKVTTLAEINKKHEAEIDEYAKKNNLAVTKTASGLRYIVTKPHTGELLKDGDSVSVHYTGKLLNGEVFDSSIPKGAPFDLVVSETPVIAAWPEALKLTGMGGKITILVPYYLGYGDRPSGPIPAFGAMVFDMEIMKVKSNGAKPTAAAPAPIK